MVTPSHLLLASADSLIVWSLVCKGCSFCIIGQIKVENEFSNDVILKLKMSLAVMLE